MRIDYRALNRQTVRIQIPLPRIDGVFDYFSREMYFSSLYSRSGYLQIRIRHVYVVKRPLEQCMDNFSTWSHHLV